MQQCNGTTLQGHQCKKRIEASKNNILDNKVYCSVHYRKAISLFQNVNSDKVITKKKQILPENLRSIIPADILPEFEMISVEDIEFMFDDYIFNDILKRAVENKIPDRLLKVIPPEILLDVGHLPISELENIFLPNENIYEAINWIDPNMVFECNCCFCESFEKDKIICSEGHTFCKECLVKYVTDRVTSGDYKLHCMAANSNCQGFFNHKLLQSILDPKLYTSYVEKEFQEIITLANIENLYTCPKCCIYSTIIDDKYIELFPPKFICLNPSCKYISCLKCKRDFHGNIICDYIKRDQNVRKTIEEILTKNRSRFCSKCNKEFIRTDGCNKMTCSCKTKSCYFCKSIIKDYDHFLSSNNTNQINGGKCPLYTKEEEIEKLSLENALDEIYNTYKNNVKIIQDEVYPILVQLEKDHKNMIDIKFSDVLHTDLKNEQVEHRYYTVPKKNICLIM